MARCYLLLIAALVAMLLGSWSSWAETPAGSPAYQIVLRSRHSQVTPVKVERAQNRRGIGSGRPA